MIMNWERIPWARQRPISSRPPTCTMRISVITMSGSISRMSSNAFSPSSADPTTTQPHWSQGMVMTSALRVNTASSTI